MLHATTVLRSSYVEITRIMNGPNDESMRIVKVWLWLAMSYWAEGPFFFQISNLQSIYTQNMHRIAADVSKWFGTVTLLCVYLREIVWESSEFISESNSEPLNFYADPPGLSHN